MEDKKYYEKEVYSVPAGRTHGFQHEYPYVYTCPSKGKAYTSIKKPLYMAFRKKEGIMERLFGLDCIITADPANIDSFMKLDHYSDEVKDRIKHVCDRYDLKTETQFFILSETNQIELKHKPRPARNNSFRAYYTLSELLDSDKTIVELENAANKKKDSSNESSSEEEKNSEFEAYMKRFHEEYTEETHTYDDDEEEESDGEVSFGAQSDELNSAKTDVFFPVDNYEDIITVINSLFNKSSLYPQEFFTYEKYDDGQIMVSLAVYLLSMYGVPILDELEEDDEDFEERAIKSMCDDGVPEYIAKHMITNYYANSEQLFGGDLIELLVKEGQEVEVQVTDPNYGNSEFTIKK